MSFTDFSMIQQLRSNDPSKQNEVFVYLYKLVYDEFLGCVLKRGGQKPEVEDLIQEGLIVLYKLAIQDKLGNVKDVKSYLFIICKNLWFKSKRKQKEVAEIDESIRTIGEEPTIMNHLLTDERKNGIEALLDKLGADCKKILVLFYYRGQSIKEIVGQTHFSSEAALKNKKRKCIQAVRKLIESSPNLQQLLRP